jgi:hypothetical protein
LSSEKRLSTRNEAGGKNWYPGMAAVRLKAGNLCLPLAVEALLEPIDILADPTEGQRDRPVMENHDTVICAPPV